MRSLFEAEKLVILAQEMERLNIDVLEVSETGRVHHYGGHSILLHELREKP